MRFLITWIESIAARVVERRIDVAVARAESRLSDCVNYQTLATQIDIDNVIEGVAERVNVKQVAKHIDAAGLADNVTDSVMDNIDQDKIQRNIEINIGDSIGADEVAQALDISEVAKHIDKEELGGYMSLDVAEAIDLHKLAGKINMRELALALIEVAADQKLKAAARAKASAEANA